MTFQVKRILIVLINIMCRDSSEKFYMAKKNKQYCRFVNQRSYVGNSD